MPSRYEPKARRYHRRTYARLMSRTLPVLISGLLVLAGIAGPPQPAGATSVSPDWTKLFGQQQQLLRQYQGIFGA